MFKLGDIVKVILTGEPVMVIQVRAYGDEYGQAYTVRLSADYREVDFASFELEPIEEGSPLFYAFGPDSFKSVSKNKKEEDDGNTNT